MVGDVVVSGRYERMVAHTSDPRTFDGQTPVIWPGEDKTGQWVAGERTGNDTDFVIDLIVQEA